ncbi:MAG: hypothetical protein O2782_02085 [bacterium]|nr:hypothetical protein [bacterium]
MTHDDFRRWLPDLLQARDLRVSVYGAEVPILQVAGDIVARRLADAPGNIARLQFSGDGLDLNVGTDRRGAALHADIDIGRRWLEMTGLSLRFDGGQLLASGSYEAGGISATTQIQLDTGATHGLLPAAWQSRLGAPTGDLQIVAQALGLLHDPQIHASFQAHDVALQGAKIDSARGRGTWTHATSDIDSIAINSDLGDVSGAGRLTTAGTMPDSGAGSCRGHSTCREISIVPGGGRVPPRECRTPWSTTGGRALARVPRRWPR